MDKDRIGFIIGLLCVAVAFGVAGLHFGYVAAINSQDLTLADGIRIETFGGIRNIHLLNEDITVWKTENKAGVIIWNGGRNISLSSEEGVFVAPGVTSIVIPDKKNASLNVSAYGEKMIVIPYSDWERYKKAKTVMDQTVRPLINQISAQWYSDNQARMDLVGARYNKTGNETDAKREMLALMREAVNYTRDAKIMAERRYICNANNSVLDALLFPGGL